MRFLVNGWLTTGLWMGSWQAVLAEAPSEPEPGHLTSNVDPFANIEAPLRQAEAIVEAASIYGAWWTAVGLGLTAFLLGITLLRKRSERRNLVQQLAEQNDKLAELTRELEATQNQLARAEDHMEDLVQSRLREIQFANQKLEQYALRVANDLKNPIRTSTGFFRLLDRELKKPATSADRVQECLRFLEEGLRHMRQVTDNILRYSRYSRHGEMFVSEVDLRKTVNQVRKALQPQIVKKGIRLQVRVEQLFLHGNTLRLEQLIQNLTEFLVTGDTAGSVITLRAADHGEEVELSIQSDAADVTGEKLRILNKVFKKSTSSLADDPWSISLRMCRKITKMHRGRLIAYGGRYQGIAFTLHLKKAFATADPHKAELPKKYRG